MPVSKLSLLSLRKQSTEALFLLRRCGPANAYHSSRHLRATKMPRGPFLEQGQLVSQSWRSYLIPTAVLGGIGGAVIFMHMNDEKRAIKKGDGANNERISTTMKGPIIGGPFTLIDFNGRLITEKDLQGDWILMYFGYTSSPDIGPSELQKLTKAITILDTKRNIKVRPVFVTIDPQRDTPSQLRAYLKEFDERIIGLTGPVGSVRQMAHEYRVYFKKVEEDGDDYLVESSHNMYLMNPSMEIVRCFGIEYNAEELSEAIYKELDKTLT